MTFPHRLLNEGEEIVFDTHPHWWIFAGATTRLVLAIVIAVVAVTNIDDNAIVSNAAILLILAAVMNLVIVYIRWRTTSLVLTTDRLITRSGIFSRQGHEIPLERINDIACHQSLFERMIGAGDLLVESAGELGQGPFHDVASPFEVQNAIHRTMEEATNRPTRGTSTAGLSIPEQIDKLDELRQRGVISDAEFQDKKRRLLDRL